METAPHRRFSWLRAHWSTVVCVGIGLLFLQVLTQLIYPYNTALPGAKLYNTSVSGKNRNQLVGTITNGFQAQTVTLATATTKYTIPLSKLGASINTDDAANQLTNYSVWQRLVPFSEIWLQPEVKQYDITFSDKVLASASAEAAKKLSANPVDAGLAIKKGELVVTKAKDGQTVTASDIQTLLKTTKFTPHTKSLTVKAITKQPSVADASVAEVKKQAEAIINRTYTLQTDGGKQITPSKSDIAGWLQVSSSNGKVVVKPDTKAVASYIKTLNARLGSSGTPAQVRMIDGVEVSRKGGKAGTAVDASDLTIKLVNAINGTEDVTLAVVMKPVTPPDSVARSYTASQKGLQAYASYLASSEQVEVAVMQLGGGGWSAYGNASSSMVSASTYKLYIATWVASQIKAGKMKLTDTILTTTVQGCLERMIVVSDNACAEAWVKKAGPTNLNNFVHSKGISSATTFTAADATRTSAADLQKVTLGIWNGTMISGSLRNTILGYMNRQVYRQGIPAGSKGRVYDKVGFLWDYLNDASVVVHPKGTYSLVIMTKVSSWAHIAEITRQIEAIMYS